MRWSAAGAGEFIEEQEDGFAQRREHAAVHGPERHLLAEPAPGHPRAEPQRRLQRLQAAPFRRLVPPDGAKYLHGPAVGRAGIGDPLHELANRVRHRMADHGLVGVVLRPGVLGHPALDGLDHFLGHLIHSRQHQAHIIGRYTRPVSGAGPGHGLT